MNHDGTNLVIQKDIALNNALVGSQPIHASATKMTVISNFMRGLKILLFRQPSVGQLWEYTDIRTGVFQVNVILVVGDKVTYRYPEWGGQPYSLSAISFSQAFRRIK